MYFTLIEIATDRTIDLSLQLSELDAAMASLCAQRNIAWEDRFKYWRIGYPV